MNNSEPSPTLSISATELYLHYRHLDVAVATETDPEKLDALKAERAQVLQAYLKATAPEDDEDFSMMEGF